MILIVDLCYKKDSLSFAEFVLSVAQHVKGYEIKHYTEEIDTTKYEKVILCGTAMKDNGYLDNIGAFNWLENFNGQVLGICAGMHLLAKLAGAEISKNIEIGMQKIITKNQNHLFKNTFEGYCIHSLGVLNHESLEILAASTDCIQAIKIKGTEKYGVQFHPEVRNIEVIKNFLSIT